MHRAFSLKKSIRKQLFLLLIVAFNNQNSFAQEMVGFLESPELNVLYRGYSNIVVPSVAYADTSKQDRFTLRGVNCSVITTEIKNQYIVKPGRGRTVKLSVIAHKGNREFIIATKEYRVSTLPDPILYWGGSKSGARASLRSRLLSAKYPPEVPLKAQFKVLKWNVNGVGGIVEGVGSNLAPAGPIFEAIKYRSLFAIGAVVRGPDGIARQVGGAWTVEPLKKEE